MVDTSYIGSDPESGHYKILHYGYSILILLRDQKRSLSTRVKTLAKTKSNLVQIRRFACLKVVIAMSAVAAKADGIVATKRRRLLIHFRHLLIKKNGAPHPYTSRLTISFRRMMSFDY